MLLGEREQSKFSLRHERTFLPVGGGGESREQKKKSDRVYVTGHDPRAGRTGTSTSVMEITEIRRLDNNVIYSRERFQRDECVSSVECLYGSSSSTFTQITCVFYSVNI
jgi:hypothetical protein